MLNKYLQDKSPELFRPRVTPDPDMQSRLAEKVKLMMEHNQRYSSGLMHHEQNESSMVRSS